MEKATKIRDYVVKNVSNMNEEQRDEWCARIWNAMEEYIDDCEAVDLLDEALNALDEATEPIQRQFPDEENEEFCFHGKAFHEPCVKCDDAAADEERAQKEADKIEKAVEYNLWYQDGGSKEIARQCHHD